MTRAKINHPLDKKIQKLNKNPFSLEKIGNGIDELGSAIVELRICLGKN